MLRRFSNGFGVCRPLPVPEHSSFGYYECEKSVAFAERAQPESPVVNHWNAYMADILELVMDPESGAQPKLEPMFRLN